MLFFCCVGRRGPTRSVGVSSAGAVDVKKREGDRKKCVAVRCKGLAGKKARKGEKGMSQFGRRGKQQ